MNVVAVEGSGRGHETPSGHHKRVMALESNGMPMVNEGRVSSIEINISASV
jgi:hypothetical protein